MVGSLESKFEHSFTWYPVSLNMNGCIKLSSILFMYIAVWITNRYFLSITALVYVITTIITNTMLIFLRASVKRESLTVLFVLNKIKT